MKDVNNLLNESKATNPQRELHANFTNNVLKGITSKPAAAPWWTSCRKGIRYMKFIQKPSMALASIAAVMAIGGTAYATVNWSSISAMFAGEQPLASGSRIVKIETDGCAYVDNLDAKGNENAAYYEIKKDSPLTNAQAVSMIQGICEEEAVNAKVGSLIKQGQIKNSLSSVITTIESLNEHTITVSYDKHYDTSLFNSDKPKTYTNLASDIKVYDGDIMIPFSSLKTGDSVVLFTTDMRGISTEDPDYVEDIASEKVVAVLKTPALTGTPHDFYKNVGKEFVRVQPTQGGFTRLYEFDK